MRANANTLKMAEQALAAHRSRLASAADKDTVRRQIAATEQRVAEIRRAMNEPADDVKPRGVYGEWCRDPETCEGLGYCPRDPTCAD